MKGIKRIFSMFLCCVIVTALFSGMALTSEAASNGFYSNGNGYCYQHDSYWWTRSWNEKDETKGKKNFGDNSLYKGGCGIFAFCHAIRFLNGISLSSDDIVNVAKWAHNNTFISKYNGQDVKLPYYTTSTYKEFYGTKLQNAYGSKFGFKIVGTGPHTATLTTTTLPPEIKTHLQNGGVAIVHTGGKGKDKRTTDGHYICLAKYRQSNGKGEFYVIESAERFNGKGITKGTGAGWVKEETLAQRDNTDYYYRAVEWYVLLQSTALFSNRANALNYLSVVNNSSAANTNIKALNRDTLPKTGFQQVECGTKTYNGKPYKMYRLVPLCAPNCAVSFYNGANSSPTGYTVGTLKKQLGDQRQMWFFEYVGTDSKVGKNYFRIHNAYNPSWVMAVGANNNVFLNEIRYESSQYWYIP